MEKLWIVLGDFNAVLRDSDRCGGNIANQNDCEEFENCLDNTNLVELKWRGNKYTWTNNQQEEDRIWRRIGRVLVSEKWLDNFECEASVLSQGISDHVALIVKFKEPMTFSFKPFRFFKMWTESKDFMEIVSKSRESLKEIQENLQLDPINVVLLKEEQALVINFRKLLRLEENFYKQKSRVQWIELGDHNTKSRIKSQSVLWNTIKSLLESIKVEEGMSWRLEVQ
ncbi:uncharacterized protein LOC126681469 [Mercurialis annua]|uniref:uncharacterized protein LOC126681469 n=1 Tax=Mercurialis annua TaxID=3986 RepID=UPI0021603723|nr:uncharacterized protein LOC126681469 [Mercurialis annua]